MDVQISNETAAAPLLHPPLAHCYGQEPAATPPVTPILGFVMNGYFVVLCRPSQQTATSSGGRFSLSRNPWSGSDGIESGLAKIRP